MKPPTTPLPVLEVKALARIEKLLRLATNNPNEHEARSAAMQCCKLMGELRVLERVSLAGSLPSSTASSIEDLMRMAQEMAFRRRYGYQPSPFREQPHRTQEDQNKEEAAFRNNIRWKK